ncbi:MAG: hypothetical protein NUW06_03175 [Candidatus Acetothermia bacterium]|jgi:hypothetical protein|nr:hypothetical protein [Candidatus Acetothermia bacterium]MDH7504807.1 hypothetical protein [Candidatus Acetothermia bacterium]
MAIKDLAEGLTASETLVSVWHDSEEQEVFLQYGYAALSLPREDFHDLVALLVAAEQELERLKGGGAHG